MRKKNSNFGRAGVIVCSECGKTTRDTGHGEGGLQLCASCIRDAELENSHADGYHDGAPNAQCPVCRASTHSA